MKFPITRESLLAYDPVKEAAESKEQQIQVGLNQMILRLRIDFEQAMKNDPSDMQCGACGELGHYYGYEFGHCESCGGSPPIMSNKTVAIQEKKFVWNVNDWSNFITPDNLPRFLEMVKENFIGCAVTVDPLKRYLTIDWS